MIPKSAPQLTARLAVAITGVWGVMIAAHTGLMARASLFIHYLEVSRHAEGVAGKITLWERVVYSFILSTS